MDAQSPSDSEQHSTAGAWQQSTSSTGHKSPRNAHHTLDLTKPKGLMDPNLLSIDSTPQPPSPYKSPLTREFSDSPAGAGLLLTMDSASGVCYMKFVKDQHLTHIHPNIFVPSAWYDLHELGGGGSGVTVIQGTDPEAGGVVMKHGIP